MEPRQMLAAWMREGAQKRPQSRYALFNGQGEGKTSCALGAVYEGCTGRSDTVRMDAVFRVLPPAVRAVLCQLVAHPLGTEGRWTLLQVIGDLNDVAGWTREDIARWLDGAPVKSPAVLVEAGV